MEKKYDVIVIGGGASGMMAAGRAAERGRRVLLLEKNSQLGMKLALTGGGRCNICNAQENHKILLKKYGSAERFLYSPFSQFGVKDTFDFFTGLGLPLKVEANQRAFPKTENATDVIRALERYMKKHGVTVQTNSKVDNFIVENNQIEGIKVDGRVISARTYILATGGKSHPETGSTGDGFLWLSKLGCKVAEPTPTIVPLAVQDKWIKKLAGVALDDAKITFFTDGKKAFSIKGRVLCTHFGISGPIILNSSGKVADLLYDGKVTAGIDLYPHIDLGKLDKHITAIFDENKNKALVNVIKSIVPPGTGPVILSLLPQIDPEKKVHSISKSERKQLVNLLKSLPLTITRLMGLERAVVVDGGLSIREVEARTMQSRKYNNLYVTGDLLHISRPSGGYSLQLCWTTAWVAGSNA
ncbi:MAG: aminoacetone oxidase family FAD-binding enzyme [Patescibacteria group bacterium]